MSHPYYAAPAAPAPAPYSTVYAPQAAAHSAPYAPGGSSSLAAIDKEMQSLRSNLDILVRKREALEAERSRLISKRQAEELQKLEHEGQKMVEIRERLQRERELWKERAEREAQEARLRSRVTVQEQERDLERLARERAADRHREEVSRYAPPQPPARRGYEAPPDRIRPHGLEYEERPRLPDRDRDYDDRPREFDYGKGKGKGDGKGKGKGDFGSRGEYRSRPEYDSPERRDYGGKGGRDEYGKGDRRDYGGKGERPEYSRRDPDEYGGKGDRRDSGKGYRDDAGGKGYRDDYRGKGGRDDYDGKGGRDYDGKGSRDYYGGKGGRDDYGKGGRDRDDYGGKGGRDDYGGKGYRDDSRGKGHRDDYGGKGQRDGYGKGGYRDRDRDDGDRFDRDRGDRDRGGRDDRDDRDSGRRDFAGKGDRRDYGDRDDRWVDRGGKGKGKGDGKGKGKGDGKGKGKGDGKGKGKGDGKGKGRGRGYWDSPPRDRSRSADRDRQRARRRSRDAKRSRSRSKSRGRSRSESKNRSRSRSRSAKADRRARSAEPTSPSRKAAASPAPEEARLAGVEARVTRVSLRDAERTCRQLRDAYPNLPLSPDFSHLLVYWHRAMAAGDIAMPNRGQYTFRINTSAGYVPPFANTADQDEDGMRHHVRVAVLGCQSLLATSGGPMGLNVLVGEAEEQLVPIGGSWSRELDGPDPDDEATLQATARRVALAFCGLELTDVPLVKLTELRFSPATLRGEAAEGEASLSAPERTVFYLAAPWTGNGALARVDVRSQAILPPKETKEDAASPEGPEAEAPKAEPRDPMEEDAPADGDGDLEEEVDRKEPPLANEDAQPETSEGNAPEPPTDPAADAEGSSAGRQSPDAMVMDAEAEGACEGLADPPPAEGPEEPAVEEGAVRHGDGEEEQEAPEDADAKPSKEAEEEEVAKEAEEEEVAATTSRSPVDPQKAMEEDMDEVRKALLAQLFRVAEAVPVAGPLGGKPAAEAEPEQEPERVVVQMVTRPLLSLVDPPLASKPATFELSVLAETLWEMWQYTYGLVVYDALKAFADKIDEWVERQKRKRAREEDAEDEAVEAKKAKGDAEGEDGEGTAEGAEPAAVSTPPAAAPEAAAGPTEPVYDPRFLEAFRYFDLRAADCIRCSDLDAVLQSLRLGLTAEAIARLVRPHTPKGRQLRVVEYLDVCDTQFVPTEVSEEAE
eukprot:EG_transcript_763